MGVASGVGWGFVATCLKIRNGCQGGNFLGVWVNSVVGSAVGSGVRVLVDCRIDTLSVAPSGVGVGKAVAPGVGTCGVAVRLCLSVAGGRSSEKLSPDSAPHEIKRKLITEAARSKTLLIESEDPRTGIDPAKMRRAAVPPKSLPLGSALTSDISFLYYTRTSMEGGTSGPCYGIEFGNFLVGYSNSPVAAPVDSKGGAPQPVDMRGCNTRGFKTQSTNWWPPPAGPVIRTVDQHPTQCRWDG